MTLSEAAAWLRVQPGELEEEARSGRIPGISVAGQWRFSQQSIREMMKPRTIGAWDRCPEWNAETQTELDADLQMFQALRRSLGTAGDLQEQSS